MTEEEKKQLVELQRKNNKLSAIIMESHNHLHNTQMGKAHKVLHRVGELNGNEVNFNEKTKAFDDAFLELLAKHDIVAGYALELSDGARTKLAFGGSSKTVNMIKTAVTDYFGAK